MLSLAISVLLIMADIKYNNFTIKYRVISIVTSLMYGVFSAYIFLKPELYYEDWSNIRQSSLKSKLSAGMQYMLMHMRYLMLYAILAAIIMTWWVYYIRTEGLQFYNFGVVFVGWSIFGGSLYGLYSIIKSDIQYNLK